MIIELPLGQGAGRPDKMGYYHFPNNNLAIRRKCAEEVGGYDPKAVRSEDVDICFRVARSEDWVAFREGGVTIRHKARGSVGALIRQLWGWGILLARPYKKTGDRGVYLYWVRSRTASVRRRLEIPWLPGLTCVFITDYHLAHGTALLAAVCALLGAISWAAAFGALSAYFAWEYLVDVRRAGLPVGKSIQLAALHYLANTCFQSAAFLGGLRNGILFVPATIFRSRDSAKP